MDASDDRLTALSARFADHLRTTLERELVPIVSAAVEAERLAGEDRLKSERIEADERLRSERSASDDRLKSAVD